MGFQGDKFEERLQTVQNPTMFTIYIYIYICTYGEGGEEYIIKDI